MKKTSIGGSALIEGLMMTGNGSAAIAVRKSDGSIILEKQKLPIRGKWYKLPVLRGALSFINQMVLSTRALMFSASAADIEEESPSKLDKMLEKVLGDKIKDVIVYFSLIFSLAFSIGLFILLPNILAGLINLGSTGYKGVIYYNILEGTIRILLFLCYLVMASRLEEMKRVWQYHGAEHKTINCYECGDSLTAGNVMKHSTKNPRCSTSYLFIAG